MDQDEEMKLIMEKGEPLEQQAEEGTLINEIRTREETTIELLQGINKKLDVILNAQGIREVL